MPLLSVKTHGALRCRAKAKHSQLQCQNPAAFKMKVCRMHGARKKERILKNEQHPHYKHGAYTQETKANYTVSLGEIKGLEKLLKKLRMIN